jgi:23S rRNA (adenine2030-N6)-methyltransferase
VNYRHHFHAGNWADVFKHALLLVLIRGLQRKDKGFLYLDTHAGRGGYELDPATLPAGGRERPPEWPQGIGRIWNETSGPLLDYLARVRQFNLERGASNEGPRYYPGSPMLAAMMARPADRLALCELREDDAEALRAEFQFHPGVSTQGLDGYTALRAMLPPPEKRALILIDPPFESATEFAEILQGLREALRRFPTGVYAVWYPITERARSDWFQHQFMGLSPPPTLAAELQVAGDASAVRMKGCGLLVLNPPWRIDAEVRSLLAVLVEKLALDDGATARVKWLVSEK